MFDSTFTRSIRAFVLILILCSSVQASRLDTLVEPPYSSPKLSPDGLHLAVIEKDQKGKMSLLIIDSANLKAQRYYPRTSRKDKANVTSFEWVSEDTIVLTSDAFKNSEALHKVVVGQRRVKNIETRGRFSVIDPIPHNTRFMVVNRPSGNDWGVCKVEIRDTLDDNYIDILYSCDSSVLEAVTDSNHELRMIKRNLIEGESSHWFWNNGVEWQQSTLPSWSRVYGFEYGKKDIAFVGGSLGHVLPGIYLYDLSVDQTQRLLFEHPTYSIEQYAQPLVHGHPRVVMGYQLDVDMPRTVWLSTKLKYLQKFADRLFSGSLNIIRDWDLTYEHMLVERVILDSPSHLVWVDVKNEKFKVPLINGGKVEAKNVGRSRFVTIKNRHGVEMSSLITIPKVKDTQGLPLVVFIRSEAWDGLDRYKWCPEAQYMAANGMVVLRINMRGSSGSLNEFSADLKTLEGLRGFFEDIEDGIDELVKVGLVDSSRVGIAGSGKGGWVAACAPVASKGKYKAVVALNGIYDLGVYRKTFDEDDSIKDTIGIEFANPGSGLSDQILAQFSPMKHLDQYADALFVSYGKWSSPSFKSHAHHFISEARKNHVRVGFFNDDWWGDQMVSEQRMRAWKEATDLLVSTLIK